MTHAGGGLIQHEERRLRRQRAGDLETTLVTIGQFARHQKTLPLQTYPGQEFLRHLTAALALPTVARQPQERLHQARPGTAEARRNDVLEGIEMLKELDVLEGAP